MPGLLSIIATKRRADGLVRSAGFARRSRSAASAASSFANGESKDSSLAGYPPEMVTFAVRWRPGLSVDVLDTFQPPSRRGNANTYCRTNLDHSIIDAGNHRGQCSQMFRKIDDCRNMDQMKQLYTCRYRKLNIHSYFRHQTLEVRHHSGTTDPAKITNWVRLMARMFDAAESAAAVRNRPEDNGVGMPRMKWFFQAIDARGLTKFYTERAKKLAA